MSPRTVVTGVMLCAVLFAARAEAQRPVRWGLKAGIAASDIGGGFGDQVDATTRFGVSGGPFATISLGGVFHLQPELLYVSRGATTRIELRNYSGIPIGQVDVTYVLDYLEIPLLARIALPAGGPVRPSLLAGPALAIKLRSRFNAGEPLGWRQNLNDVTRGDVGLVMGAAVDFGRGPRGVVLDGRYTLGLTNVWGPQSVVNARNRAFALMAGYRF